MPIYEYTCPKCGATFDELVRSAREERAVACPKCGERRVARRLSTFAAHAAATRPARPPGCGRCGEAGGSCPLGR